jgi:hypothetical protein
MAEIIRVKEKSEDTLLDLDVTQQAGMTGSSTTGSESDQ